MLARAIRPQELYEDNPGIEVVKEECLNRLVIVGEAHLRPTLVAFWLTSHIR